jgi:hypothetical protein
VKASKRTGPIVSELNTHRCKTPLVIEHAEKLKGFGVVASEAQTRALR